MTTMPNESPMVDNHDDEATLMEVDSEVEGLAEIEIATRSVWRVDNDTVITKTHESLNLESPKESSMWTTLSIKLLVLFTIIIDCLHFIH